MNQYVYTVQASRLGMLDNPTEEEKEIAEQHLAYMSKLFDDGIAIFGGALGVRDSRHMGLVIYQAEDDAAAKGIALTPSSADGDVFVLAYTQGSSGSVDLGATLTVGEAYVVSTNKGAIAPIGDLTTGDYVTVLGIASAADNLLLNINVSGVVKP